MKTMTLLLAALTFVALAAWAAAPARADEKPGTSETKQIAEEAYTYGFPIVMGYGIMYE